MYILNSTGICWDFVDSNTQGGTTTTGITVRRLLLDEKTASFSELLKPVDNPWP